MNRKLSNLLTNSFHNRNLFSINKLFFCEKKKKEIVNISAYESRPELLPSHININSKCLLLYSYCL